MSSQERPVKKCNMHVDPVSNKTFPQFHINVQSIKTFFLYNDLSVKSVPSCHFNKNVLVRITPLNRTYNSLFISDISLFTSDASLFISDASCRDVKSQLTQDFFIESVFERFQ